MMQYQRLKFIVNPGAGSTDEVTQLIPEVFADCGYQWEVIELQPDDEVAEVVKSLVGDDVLVAVCGGDGSVTEAARGLIGSKHPLAIIPGGTANVLAKELGIPQDIKQALELLKSGHFKIMKMDTGTVNGKPFLLRVNLGIMAEMVVGANGGLKDKMGQLAYGVSLVKTAWNSEPVKYTLDFDGEVLEMEGVSLTVTNSGHMGVGELQMRPGISITDGLLDIVLLKDSGIFSLMKAAGSTLFETESDAIFHRTCNTVNISFEKEQLYICDDCEERGTSLKMAVVPSSLNIIVPVEEQK